MKELSHHILDIAMNSVRGEADKITISLKASVKDNWFEFKIIDDGKGIKPEMLATLKDPFTTSRTMRKVGLGIPLLNDTCMYCEGSLVIESTVDVGTSLIATMKLDHIDRPPLGDIGSTISGIMGSYGDIELEFLFVDDDDEFSLTTSEMKEELDGVPLYNVEVMQWITETVNEAVSVL